MMHEKATKILVTTFILLFFFQLSESLAQTNWTMLNTETGGKALLGISGSSPKDVFAVGVNGIVRRYDGTRIDMQEIESGTEEILNAVWGDFDEGVFVVGDKGIARYLYKNTEPIPMTVPTEAGTNPPHLYGIWGISKTNVFVVGANGTILHYDGDGDNNNTLDYIWEPMKNPDSNTNILKGIWGSSARNVFAVGANGTILRYDGDGDNDGKVDYYWERMTSRTRKNLSGIWGSSARNVFAVGADGIILRYDGDGDNDGMSDDIWEPMESGIDIHLNSIWGSSARNVFAVGNQGTVRYYNGNEQMIWSGLQNDWPHTENLNGVWVSNNPHVFVIGDNGIGGYLEQKYGIQGEILEACANQAIVGAKIYAWQNNEWEEMATTTSNGYGTIEFDDEQVTLKFSKDTSHDYEEITVSLAYQEVIDNDTYLLKLSEYAGCIAGVISELSGSYYKPISGVDVNLYKAVGCEFPSTPDDDFETGTDGHFYFTGWGEGTYKIEPIKTGYTFTPQYPALPHQSPQAYDFTPAP
jgi:hypothetical protein